MAFRLALYLLTLYIIPGNIVFSQISGRISDQETGLPLPGATITVTGEDTGTVSDADGFFSLTTGGQVIRVSAIGYSTEIIEISQQKSYYSIYLRPKEYQLQEVVVEAFNRSRRLVDVPGSISLIQRNRIERENPVTVVPVLNNIPGVFAHSGALNTSRITIRGIGARVPYATGKVRAYLNNIPLTNGSGESIVEDIDPAIMERIEIIKGPATSVYGAGLGGTIIITAQNPSVGTNGVNNRFQAGSWDLYRNTISVSSGDENLGINIGYNHTQSNGYRENNSYRRNGITAVSQFKPAEPADVTFILNYTSLKAHIPSSIDSATFVASPRSAAQNWLRTRGYEDYDKVLAGISAGYTLSGSLSANLSLFSTMHNEKEMRPFDVLHQDRLSGGTRLKITWLGSMPGGSLQITGGGELYTENYGYTSFENIGGAGERGSMISDNSERINYYNIFSQADYDMHLLKLSAGINLNNSKVAYRDLMGNGDPGSPQKYSYGQIVSPRLSANYRYYMNNSVFITISHGFSPPSIAETLTPEGSVNPDIKPETSWNFEWGLRGNLFSNRLFYDLNLYRMQVTNLLVAERVGEDAWVGRNAGESVHRGIELELQFLLMSNTNTGSAGWWEPVEISLLPNMTINNFRFTDFVDEGVDYSGNILPGIPEYTVNTGIHTALGGGLYSLVNIRNAGRMAMNDSNSLYSEPYRISNITIGYRSALSSRLNSDIYFSANNIFNEKYASMILVNAPVFNDRPARYYYPGNPVNLSAGLKIGYKFN